MIAAIGFFLSGCATVNVPQLGSKSIVIQDDERRLMNRSKELREILDRSGFLYEDRLIEDYLKTLVHKLLPQGVGTEEVKINVKIIKDPVLNAISFPDGQIYVHTGILATAENESQLATLLAHEISHVIHRHALKSLRATKNKTAWWDSFSWVLTAGMGALVGELAKITSVSGYSQALETEADEIGFKTAKEAGFDVSQSIKLFELMKQYSKDDKNPEQYFFSSHPRLLERIKNYKRLMKEYLVTENSVASDTNYQNLVHELIIENLKLCLEKGMYVTVENQLPRLFSIYPNDARIALIKGDLYRERQDPQPKMKVRDKAGDYTLALEAYDEALKQNSSLAQALLGKGRILYAQGNKQSADYLNQFLLLEPTAKNKNSVEYLIKKANELP